MVDGNRSGGWRRRRACASEKLRFLTLAKENQSPLGSYRNPPTFSLQILILCFNLWPAFCFVLSPRLSWITQRRRPTSSIVIHRMTVRCSERKMFIMFEIWIPIWLQEGWGMFYYRCVHFISRLLSCWQQTTAYPTERLGGDRTIFNITDWIRLKEETHTYDVLRVSKTQANFQF